MDAKLKHDLEHFFSVFLNNAQNDVQNLLPPTPATDCYQAELELEFDLLRASILNRVEEEFRH